ncbi:MAG: uroporphyrinogen-III C-methyltransferase [Polyangiaceae bacterium]
MRQPAATSPGQTTSDPTGARPGTVYLVGAGPGDPDLLTLRGAALLATADVVLHDDLVHPALLSLVAPTCEVRFVGKRGGAPQEKQATQSAIDASLIELARRDLRVVRLKGGDPFLFGRGSEEAEALAAAGVPFEIVPGVTAALAVPAYAGISLTHRDLASSVTFVSGTTRKGRPFNFREIAGVSGTICVLMGMRRIEDVCRALIDEAGKPPDTPSAVIERGTRPEQRTLTAPLSDLAASARVANLSNPALIVVGPVTTLRPTIRWFDTLPLFGKRVLVTRAEHQSEDTAHLLRRRGADPISLPVIELRPPPDPARVDRAIADLSTYDLVAFTSENGVDRFFTRLRETGKDLRAFATARIAAIGAGTARALAQRGALADIVPERFVGEAFAESILATLAPSRTPNTPVRVLLPRALVAREVVPETLRKAGFHVDVVPVYETVPPSPARRDSLLQRLTDRTLDIVMLTSSSTAANLCDLLGEDSLPLLKNTLIASIGPITTATAEKRGLEVAVTAETSTLPGLVEAIELHLAGHPSSPAPCSHPAACPPRPPCGPPSEPPPKPTPESPLKPARLNTPVSETPRRP